ncbi:MAG: OmpA family protein, partial [Pseudomonas sp.]
MLPIKSFSALALCVALAGCASSPETPDASPAKPEVASAAKAESGGHWWWPFGDDKAEAKAAAVPMPDPKITQAWMDDYE